MENEDPLLRDVKNETKRGLDDLLGSPTGGALEKGWMAYRSVIVPVAIVLAILLVAGILVSAENWSF